MTGGVFPGGLTTCDFHLQADFSTQLRASGAVFPGRPTLLSVRSSAGWQPSPRPPHPQPWMTPALLSPQGTCHPCSRGAPRAWSESWAGKASWWPVDSLASALRLHPFCLVRKKHRRHLWPWDAPLIPTDFSLVDALEPGSPIPGTFRWGWQAAELGGCRAARKKIHVGEQADTLLPGTQSARACLAWSHTAGTPAGPCLPCGRRMNRFLPPVPAVR